MEPGYQSYEAWLSVIWSLVISHMKPGYQWYEAWFSVIWSLVISDMKPGSQWYEAWFSVIWSLVLSDMKPGSQWYEAWLSVIWSEHNARLGRYCRGWLLKCKLSLILHVVFFSLMQRVFHLTKRTASSRLSDTASQTPAVTTLNRFALGCGLAAGRRNFYNSLTVWCQIIAAVNAGCQRGVSGSEWGLLSIGAGNSPWLGHTGRFFFS